MFSPSCLRMVPAVRAGIREGWLIARASIDVADSLDDWRLHSSDVDRVHSADRPAPGSPQVREERIQGQMIRKPGVLNGPGAFSKRITEH